METLTLIDPDGVQSEAVVESKPTTLTLVDPSGSESQVELAQSEQLGPLDRKTWSDAFSDLSRKTYEYLPYVNAVSMFDSARMLKISRRVQDGTASRREQDYLNRWLAERQRETSFGYKVWDTILRLPAFALEFATSGGIVKGALTAAKLGSKKAIIDVAEHATLGYAERKSMLTVAKMIGDKAAKTGAQKAENSLLKLLTEETGQQLGKLGTKWFESERALAAKAGDAILVEARNKAREAALRAAGRHAIRAPVFGSLQLVTPPMIDNLASGIMQSMTPTFGLTPDEQGKLHRVLIDEGDNFFHALAKTFGDQAIENWSEQLGENLVLLKAMFGGAASVPLKAGAISTGFQKTVKSIIEKSGVKPPVAVKMARELLFGRPGERGLLERAGWNGWFAEMAEEAAGGTLRSLVGIQPWSMPDFETVAAMGVGFLFNPLAVSQIAKDTAYEKFYKPEFQANLDAVNAYAAPKDIKSAEGVEVDAFRRFSDAKPLMKRLSDLIGYYKAEQDTAKFGLWQRMKRKLWLDGLQSRISRDLFSKIDARMVDTILERMAKADIDTQDVKVMRNALQQITGKMIVNDDAKIEDLAKYASQDEVQMDDGKIVGFTPLGINDVSSSPVLIVKVSEAGGEDTMTIQQFEEARKEHPFLWARTSASENIITPLKTIDGNLVKSEEGHEHDLIDTEKITKDTVHYWGAVLGVNQIQLNIEPFSQTPYFRVAGTDALVAAVKQRAEMVNGLAEHMPQGWLVNLTGGHTIYDTYENLTKFLGYDHPDLQNMAPTEKRLLRVPAYMSAGNRTISLSNTFRPLDMAEEVVHALTLWGGKIDPYFQAYVDSARKQMQKLNMVGFEKMSDSELLAKLLVTRMLGHRSDHENDFSTIFYDKLRLVREGQTDKSGQDEIKNATEIYAYLKHRAAELGWKDGVVEFLSAATARYHTEIAEDEVFSSGGFRPELEFDQAVDLALSYKHDGDIEIPDLAKPPPAEYDQLFKNFVDEITKEQGVSHADIIRRWIDQGGDAARPVLVRILRDLYTGQRLVNNQLPNLLTRQQYELRQQHREEAASKPVEKPKKKGKRSRRRTSRRSRPAAKKTSPTIEGFDDVPEGEEEKGGPSIKGFDDEAGTSVEDTGQDPSKPNIGDEEAKNLGGDPKPPKQDKATKPEKQPKPGGMDVGDAFDSMNFSLEPVGEDEAERKKIEDENRQIIQSGGIKHGDDDDWGPVSIISDEEHDTDESYDEFAKGADEAKPFNVTETEQAFARLSNRMNRELVELTMKRTGGNLLKESGYFWLDLKSKGVEQFGNERFQAHQANLVDQTVAALREHITKIEASIENKTFPRPEGRSDEEHEAAIKAAKTNLERKKAWLKRVDTMLKDWRDIHYAHGGEVQGRWLNGGVVVLRKKQHYKENAEGKFEPTKITYEIRQVSEPSRDHHHTKQYFVRWGGKGIPAIRMANHELRRVQETGLPWRVILGAEIDNSRPGSRRNLREIPMANVTGEMLREMHNQMMESGGMEPTWGGTNQHAVRHDAAIEALAEKGYWMFVSRNGEKASMLQVFVTDLTDEELEDHLARYEKYFQLALPEEQDVLVLPKTLRESFNDKSARRRLTDYLRRWDLSIKIWGTGAWWVKKRSQDEAQRDPLLAFDNFANLTKRKSKLATPGLPARIAFDFIVIKDEIGDDPAFADGAMFYTQATFGKALSDYYGDTWYNKGRSWIAKGFMVYNHPKNANAEIGHHGDLVQVKPGMFDIDELLRRAKALGQKERYKGFRAIKEIIERERAVVIMSSALKADGGGAIVPNQPFASAADYFDGKWNHQLKLEKHRFDATQDGPQAPALYVTTDPNKTNDRHYEQFIKQAFHVRFNLPREMLRDITELESRAARLLEKTLSKKADKNLIPVGEQKDDDFRSYGQLQAMLRNGASPLSLINGYDHVKALRVGASQAYSRTGKKHAKTVVYSLPMPERRTDRSVVPIDYGGSDGLGNSVFMPMPVDANIPGNYTEDSIAFDSREEAEKWLRKDSGTVYTHPWMYWWKTERQGGRLTLVKTDKIRSEKIIKGPDGKFRFAGQPVLDIRVPLSGENLQNQAFLDRRISGSNAQDVDQPINGIIGSQSSDSRAGVDKDLDAMHQKSLMPNQPDENHKEGDLLTFDMSADTAVGMLNQAMMLWMQALDVNTRTEEGLKSIVNLKNPVLRNYVREARTEALRDGRLDARLDMNPFHIRGMSRAIDGSSGAKKALEIFAANSGVMRLAGLLGLTGSFENFRTGTANLQVSNREGLTMTYEQASVRDFIWNDYTIQMAVDDEKDPMLSWMGITPNTAPLVLVLGFGAPVFDGVDQKTQVENGLQYLVNVFRFLNSPAVRHYDELMNEQRFVPDRMANYIDPDQKSRPSVERSMQIWARAGKKDKELTDEDRRNIQDVDALYKILRIGAGLNAMRAFLNYGFQPTGMPTNGLAARLLIEQIHANQVPGLNLEKLSSSSGLLAWPVRFIERLVSLQNYWWQNDVSFDENFVKVMREFNAENPIRNAYGAFYWQQKAMDLRRELIGQIAVAAIEKMAGTDYQSWLMKSGMVFDDVPSGSNLTTYLNELKEQHPDNLFLKALVGEAGQYDNPNRISIGRDDRYLEPDDYKLRLLATDLASLPEDAQRVLAMYLAANFPEDNNTNFGSWKHVAMQTPYFVRFNEEYAQARRAVAPKLLKQLTGEVEDDFEQKQPAEPEAPAEPGAAQKAIPVGPWTRAQVAADKDYLYVFTDNAGRTSGKNSISSDSWYYQKYGGTQINVTLSDAANDASIRKLSDPQLARLYQLVDAADTARGGGDAMRRAFERLDHEIGLRTHGSALTRPGKMAWAEDVLSRNKRVLYYPTMTQAVIRGLENAYPITTMVDHRRTQWTEDRFDEFKAIIDDEISAIKLDSQNYKGIKFSGGAQERDQKIGQGNISKLPAKLQAYLDKKLLEIGIDQGGEGTSQTPAEPEPPPAPPAPEAPPAPPAPEAPPAEPAPTDERVFNAKREFDRVMEQELAEPDSKLRKAVEFLPRGKNGKEIAGARIEVISDGRKSRAELVDGDVRVTFSDIMDKVDVRNRYDKETVGQVGIANMIVKRMISDAMSAYLSFKGEVKPLPSVINENEIVFDDGTIGQLNDGPPGQGQVEAVRTMVNAAIESIDNPRDSEPKTIVISGKPGTGKTTIVREFLRRIRIMRGRAAARTIVMGAPYWQAAGVIENATSWWEKNFNFSDGSASRETMPTTSVHKILNGHPADYRTKPGDHKEQGLPITRQGDKYYIKDGGEDGTPWVFPTVASARKSSYPPAAARARVVVVDEASTLPDSVLRVLRAYQAEFGFTLIFLGDPDQLPQVRDPKLKVGVDSPDIGAVFSSLKEPVTKITLSRVMRQKEGNHLLDVSDEVRQAIHSPPSKAVWHNSSSSMNSKGEGYLKVTTGDIGRILKGVLTTDVVLENPNAVRIYTPRNEDADAWNATIKNMLFPGSERRVEPDMLLRTHNQWSASSSKPPPAESAAIEALGLVPYHRSDAMIVNWVGSRKLFDVRIGGTIGNLIVNQMLEPLRKIQGRWVDMEAIAAGMPATGNNSHRMFLVENGEDEKLSKAFASIKRKIDEADITAKEALEARNFLKALRAGIVSFAGDGEEGGQRVIGLGYASTVHKGQGSQSLISILDNRNNGLAPRYTILQLALVGLTRAEKLALHVVADKGNLLSEEEVQKIRSMIRGSGIVLRVPEFVEDSSSYGQNRNQNQQKELDLKEPGSDRNLSADLLEAFRAETRPTVKDQYLYKSGTPENLVIEAGDPAPWISYSLEDLDKYMDLRHVPAIDETTAMHRRWWAIRNKFQSNVTQGKNYADQIMRVLGFDENMGVYWGDPDENGKVSVYDADKFDDQGRPVRLAELKDLATAQQWARAENKKRKQEGYFKKPKHDEGLVTRVLSALTAMREGSDFVVSGIRQKADKKPAFGYAIWEVVDGRRRLLKQVAYEERTDESTDGIANHAARLVEQQNEAEAEVQALRDEGREIVFNPKTHMVEGESLEAILKDYRHAQHDADGRLKQALELYGSAMKNRSAINEEMRSIVGDNWLHYWEGEGSGKYVPHMYAQKGQTQEEVEKERLKFRRRESSRRIEPRLYDSYLTAAMEGGLVPVTMNAAELITAWHNDVWNNAVVKTAVAMGMTMVDSDGAPLWLPNFVTDKDFDVSKMRLLVSDFVLRRAYDNLLGYVNNELLRRDKPLIKPPAGLPKDVGNDAAALKFLVNAYKDLVNQAEDVLKQANYVVPVKSLDNMNTFQNVSFFRVRRDPLPNARVGRTLNQERLLMRLIQPPYTFRPFGGADWLKGFERFNNWSKHMGLSLSLFHPVSLFESFLGSQGVAKDGWMTAFWPPAFIEHVRKMSNLRRRGRSSNELIQKWAEAGMKFDMTNPNYDESQLHQDANWIRQNFPLMRPVLAAWEGLNRKNNSWLWSTVFPTLKLYVAEETHRELVANFKERQKDDPKLTWDDFELRRQISTYANDIFGGQNWDQYIWATPRNMQLLHLLWFAPDWTLSAFNSAMGFKVPVIKDLLKYKPGEQHVELLQERYWPAMLMIVMTSIPAIAQSMIYAMAKAMPGPDDDEAALLPLLNEPGKTGFFGTGVAGHIDLTPLLKKLGWVPIVGYEGGDTGKRRVYLRWAKQATEVFEGWLTEPQRTLYNKLSTGTRTLFEWLTGSNSMGQLGFKEQPFLIGLFKGEDGFTDSRLGVTLEKFVPMSLLSVLQGRPSTFFAPSSRGMSQYTGTEKLAELITAYSERGVWKSIRGSKEHPVDLSSLGLDILDAVERNGYDPGNVLISARRAVLAHYYREFFISIDHQKWERAEEIANMILRVNSGVKDVFRSMQQRYKNVGRELDHETAVKIGEIFDQAELERRQRAEEQAFGEFISGQDLDEPI